MLHHCQHYEHSLCTNKKQSKVHDLWSELRMDLVSYAPSVSLPPPKTEVSEFCGRRRADFRISAADFRKPGFLRLKNLQPNSQEVFQPQRYLFSRRKF
jgi:hypothetical protein